jgi:WD repeat-containing protein 21A
LTRSQGITLDPSERFLFAAGADHRLRAWALDSGAPVASSASPSPSPSPYAPSTSRTAVDGDSSRNPFTMRFATDFSALQVVDADDGPGQVLWASGGSEVWRWRLGV